MQTDIKHVKCNKNSWLSIIMHQLIKKNNQGQIYLFFQFFYIFYINSLKIKHVKVVWSNFCSVLLN